MTTQQTSPTPTPSAQTATTSSTDPRSQERPSGFQTRVWPIVAMREIQVKLRDKNFVVGTVITLAIIAASLGLQFFLQGKSDEKTVAVSGAQAAAVVQRVQQEAAAADDGLKLTVSATSPQDALRQVRDENADLAIIQDADSWRLVGKSDVDAKLGAYVQQAVSAQTLQDRAAAVGTSAAALTAGSSVQRVILQGDDNQLVRYVVGFAFTFLFYMASLLFGMAIAQSVIEEKQSRIVEILVSAVPLRQLLVGKVVGNSLLALAQMVLFVGVGLIGLSFTPFGANMGAIAMSAGWFLVFFLAGFVALACLWAVAGSLATRSEDLQSTTPVLTTLLVVAMFMGLVAEGTLRVVASYLPVVSTIAMPQRLLAGGVAPWEPVVSLLVTVVFAVVCTILGERLYRRSILQTGRRMSYREALRATD